MADKKLTRIKCANKFCINHYNAVVGAGARARGSICIPCLYAEQMLDQCRTPAEIEGVPSLRAHFEGVLRGTGWMWEDVKKSYALMEARRG